MGFSGDEIELPGGIIVRRIQNSTYGALSVETSEVKFIWKNLIAGNHNGWNELAAYRLSQLLNVPYVPTTLVCEIWGQCGTVSQFIPNALSPSDIQFDQEKRKQIKSFLMSREFVQKVVMMLAFDAILGNKDRHAGNWLIDWKCRKMWWIDHGSVRWVSSERTTLDAFKKLGYTLKVLGMSQKYISQIISGVKDGLAIFSEGGIQSWREIMHQEWVKLFEDMPEQANQFNRDEARDNSWGGFQYIVMGKGLKISEREMNKVLSKIERWTMGEKLE